MHVHFSPSLVLPRNQTFILSHLDHLVWSPSFPSSILTTSIVARVIFLKHKSDYVILLLKTPPVSFHQPENKICTIYPGLKDLLPSLCPTSNFLWCLFGPYPQCSGHEGFLSASEPHPAHSCFKVSAWIPSPYFLMMSPFPP